MTKKLRFLNYIGKLISKEIRIFLLQFIQFWHNFGRVEKNFRHMRTIWVIS